ncbi:hypothetical protein WG907_05055 [Sphingobium sp. AN558]|uniref:hypothetical protein n=1 Tax=Sphingobium sp. AN558 TaxID=3133442 RepID=UPI0030C54ED8
MIDRGLKCGAVGAPPFGQLAFGFRVPFLGRALAVPAGDGGRVHGSLPLGPAGAQVERELFHHSMPSAAR